LKNCFGGEFGVFTFLRPFGKLRVLSKVEPLGEPNKSSLSFNGFQVRLKLDTPRRERPLSETFPDLTFSEAKTNISYGSRLRRILLGWKVNPGDISCGIPKFLLWFSSWLIYSSLGGLFSSANRFRFNCFLSSSKM